MAASGPASSRPARPSLLRVPGPPGPAQARPDRPSAGAAAAVGLHPGPAYEINGGCSDDGFDYFRGRDLDGEAVLPIVWNAYRAATGSEPPARGFTIRHPELDPEWAFDFGDHERIARHLPRIAALYSA